MLIQQYMMLGQIYQLTFSLVALLGAADFPFIINSFMFVYMLRAYSLSYCVDIIELHEARIVDKLRHVMYLRSMRLLSCFHEDL